MGLFSRFSQRTGKRPVRVEIQLDSMDEELRNGLWNAFQLSIVDRMPEGTMMTPFHPFFTVMWHNFYKWPVDTMPTETRRLTGIVRKQFFEGDYLHVYDFIDFVSQHVEGFWGGYEARAYPVSVDGFRQICNGVLERELSAYRFVGDQLAPITDEIELNGISDATAAAKTGKLKGVRAHLEQGLALLSDRKEPDYRNSIKESISAVESIVRVIIGKPSATLGAALPVLDQKIGLHPAMKEAFSKLYGYTSNEGGIRHAMQDVAKPDFEDAKYMLVTCSAFVNFLIGKAAKSGIKL